MSRFQQITDQVRREIRRIALAVVKRRKALGLTQRQLDRACGFTVPTIYGIERGAKSANRTFLPNDPRIAKTIGTLDQFESNPKLASAARRAPHPARILRRAALSIRKTLRGPKPGTLSVLLTLCPDHETKDGPDEGLWITQSGCEAMRRTNEICRTRSNGKPCGGVRYRKNLRRKEVRVQYTSPKSDAGRRNHLRPEDWV